jgi:hypothetical protein
MKSFAASLATEAASLATEWQEWFINEQGAN